MSLSDDLPCCSGDYIKHIFFPLTSTLPFEPLAIRTSPTPDPTPLKVLMALACKESSSHRQATSEKSASRQRISAELHKNTCPRLVNVIEVGKKSGLGRLTLLDLAPLCV